MQEANTRFQGLDDWQVVGQLLPTGWQEAARTLGALRRTRGIKSADLLLRVLLIHLAEGCSLKETALRARQAGWCSLSGVSLFKRLRASGEWLRWMSEQLWRGRVGPGIKLAGWRVRAIDATTVQEQGAKGTDWRVHFAVRLEDLSCDFFELTDTGGGESFRRVPVQPGDLIMGDRAYGTAPGIAHVLEGQAQVLVRINSKNLPLFRPSGAELSLLALLRGLKMGQVGQWAVCVHHGDKAYRGRLVAIKRGRSAAEAARRRLKRAASKEQRKLSGKTLEAAGYVFVFTTLPRAQFSAAEILELYRLRWQIEMAFKRMKSLLGLGNLPKHADASSRAWLHGKLLVALLIEQLLAEAEHFSPWGYRLDARPQPVA
jgi:hypothetical protein